jgi:hypothetical protein
MVMLSVPDAGDTGPEPDWALTKMLCVPSVKAPAVIE